MKYTKVDPKQFDILLIDDNANNLRLLSTVLTSIGYRVRRAISGQMALRAIKSHKFDLIMLDINMPEMNGYEVCSQIKADSQTENIPVIFISALNGTEDKVKAFEVGGADYITKPFNHEEITARVEHQIRILTLTRELEITNVSLSQEIKQKDQQLKKANSELELSRKRLLEYSLLDPVTSLDNRVALMGKLRKLLEANDPNGSPPTGFLQECKFTLYLIRYYVSRLDNNLLDLQIEDLLINSIATRIAENLPRSNYFARLNHNEFVVIFDGNNDSQQADLQARKLQKAFKNPLKIRTEAISVKIDYGIVHVDGGNKTAESIIKEARILCHQYCQSNNLKHQKKESLADSADSIQKSKKAEVASTIQDFKQTLRQHKLSLIYQPIVSLNDGSVTEVDVDFSYQKSKNKQIISRNKIESFYKNHEVSNFLLKFAFKKIKYDLRQWQDRIIWDKDLGNVNIDILFRIKLTESFFANKKNIYQSQKIASSLELDAKNIVFEIPEYLLHSSNNEHIIESLLELHQDRFNIALDNLSPEYLAISDRLNFPIHSIKVTNLNIENEQQRSNAKKVLCSIQDLKIKNTITEINNRKQFRCFQKLGYQQGMGKFFAPPTRRSHFDNLVIDRPWLDGLAVAE